MNLLLMLIMYVGLPELYILHQRFVFLAESIVVGLFGVVPIHCIDECILPHNPIFDVGCIFSRMADPIPYILLLIVLIKLHEPPAKLPFFLLIYLTTHQASFLIQVFHRRFRLIFQAHHHVQLL